METGAASDDVQNQVLTEASISLQKRTADIRDNAVPEVGVHVLLKDPATRDTFLEAEAVHEFPDDAAARATDIGAEALHLLPEASPEKYAPAACILPHLNLLKNAAAAGATALKKKSLRNKRKLLSSQNSPMLQDSLPAEVGHSTKAAGSSCDTPGLDKTEIGEDAVAALNSTPP